MKDRIMTGCTMGNYVISKHDYLVHSTLRHANQNGMESIVKVSESR